MLFGEQIVRSTSHPGKVINHCDPNPTTRMTN
jgi:hypothetical protein